MYVVFLFFHATYYINLRKFFNMLLKVSSVTHVLTMDFMFILLSCKFCPLIQRSGSKWREVWRHVCPWCPQRNAQCY